MRREITHRVWIMVSIKTENKLEKSDQIKYNNKQYLKSQTVLFHRTGVFLKWKPWLINNVTTIHHIFHIIYMLLTLNTKLIYNFLLIIIFVRVNVRSFQLGTFSEVILLLQLSDLVCLFSVVQYYVDYFGRVYSLYCSLTAINTPSFKISLK